MMTEQNMPLDLLLIAEIREAILRSCDRPAEPWEERFFLNYIRNGMSQQQMYAFLAMLPEAREAKRTGRIQEWPLTYSGWN